MTITSLKTLKQVFLEAFEQMAFLFGDVIEKDDIPPPDGPLWMVEMSFKGPFRGKLAVAIPQTASFQVAANILGVEPEDELVRRCAEDSLKEILNVVCGRFLTELAGEKPVFDLTVPIYREMPPAEWMAWIADPNTEGFQLEDFPVLLRLTL